MEGTRVALPELELDPFARGYGGCKAHGQGADTRRIIAGRRAQHGMRRHPVGTKSMEYRPGKSGSSRHIRIGMQRIVVAAQAVDQGLLLERCEFHLEMRCTVRRGR